jgi:hypothetical protein
MSFDFSSIFFILIAIMALQPLLMAAHHSGRFRRGAPRNARSNRYSSRRSNFPHPSANKLHASAQPHARGTKAVRRESFVGRAGEEAPTACRRAKDRQSVAEFRPSCGGFTESLERAEKHATGWLCSQSRANPSLPANSGNQGDFAKLQGITPSFPGKNSGSSRPSIAVSLT